MKIQSRTRSATDSPVRPSSPYRAWSLVPSRCLALATLMCLDTGQASEATPDEGQALRAWCQAQTNLQTWTAEVTQVRSLKTLAQPLSSQGTFWFAAPNRFRWEMGQPPSTIAVRQPDQLLVIYPELRRAERYRWGANQAGPWKESLALLEAGFPRDEKEFQRRYQLLEQKVTDGERSLVLQPRTPGARRMIPRIVIRFSTADFELRATELHFADGSRLRNEFHNARRNVPLPEALFEPELKSDYEVVEPLSTPGRGSVP